MTAASFNAINKIFSIFFAVFFALTGFINKSFSGDVYKWESETDAAFAEALPRSQGVTTDGKYWYFSGKHYLEKVDIEKNEVISYENDAIPAELSEKFGSKHIGGISYYDGIIYAGVEDSKVWAHPLIVLFSAEDLSFTGKYFEVPAKYHTHGIPYVIADGENSVIYAGDANNYEEMMKYDMNTGEYLGKFKYNSPVTKIQGGEYYGGFLYVGTNDSTRAVYRINVETGTAEKLFDRIMYQPKKIDNFGGEGEGLTILKMADGTSLHTLQVGATFTETSLRHYKFNLDD